MKNQEYRFSVTTETNDRTGEVMAVYFQVREGTVAKTKECAEGVAFADYDRRGKLLGIELLGPCKVKVLERIATTKPAREFVRRTVPQGMLVTI